MKKLFYTLGIIAASAFAFSACQKEQATKDEVQPEGKLVTISFTAEKAGLDTKTAAVEGETEVSFVWTADDIANIKLFTVEDGSLASEVDSPVITKVSDTKLTISATVAANATYTFRAILCDPSSYTGDDKKPYTARKPKIKTSQSPDGTTNFDPTADILVSDDKEVTVGEDETTTGDMLLSFRRQVVVNKMTLKNMVEGEKVSKVVISSDKYLTGYLDGGVMTGQSKELSLSFDDVAVPASGQFVVYFITMANTEQTLSVSVTTKQNTYSKDFTKTIDFNLGEFTKFGVALPAGTPVTTIPDGDYFITAENSSKVYAAKKYVSGNNLSNPLEITLDTANESIEYVTDIEDCIFTLTRITDAESAYVGKYTIQDANGLYLYAAGGNGNSVSNHLKGENTPDANGNAYWAVSKNTDGTYSVESAGNATRKIMRFNENNGNPVFSCYASGHTAITLYPASWCTIDTTPVLAIETSEQTKSVLSAATTVAFNYTANRYASTPVVTVTSDVDGIIADNAGAPDITVADGTITVGLIANTNDTAKSATLSVTSTGLASPVTLTINQDAYENLVSGHEDFDLTSKTYTTGEDWVLWDGSSSSIQNSSANGGTKATNFLGGDANNRTSSRFYSGNTLTIAPKTGYTITSVVFTATSTNYATALNNSTWTNASSSVSDYTVTVTPSDGTASISASVGGTCGFTKIVVNYLTAGSGSGSGSGSDTEKGASWTSGTFSATSNISSPIDGVTISSDPTPTSCETSNYARGLAWSSGKSPQITLSGYSGGIETVTLVMSTNGGSTSAVVAAGGTTLTSQSVTSGTAAANTSYTFTFSELKTGDITITITNTSVKSVWLKSISIN